MAGSQLTDRARRQALRFGAELITARSVTGLAAKGPAREVTFDDGSAIRSHAVVLATGVGYRHLEASGADDLVGRGVFYGSAPTEATGCAGQHVIIVGGANSAGQAAVFFSRHAAKVTMAVRGDSLARSMSSYLIDQIAEIDNIEVRLNTSVLKCDGSDHLQCVTLVDHDGGQQVVDAAYLFVFIGAAPLTDWLPPTLVRDRSGFVVTGPELVAGDRRPDAWTWTATRTCWSPRPRSLRGRRRTRPVGQAGRLGGRRGSAGGHPGPPVPGGEELIMRKVRSGSPRTSSAELFLFESLIPSSWTGSPTRATSSTGPAGETVYAEGDPATCFFVLLDGTLSMHRQVENTERGDHPDQPAGRLLRRDPVLRRHRRRALPHLGAGGDRLRPSG